MAPTEDARIAEIKSKVAESTETQSVPWQNTRKILNVITISLGSVLLNPRSHRIRSQIESDPNAKVLITDPFSDRAQEIIERILRETPGFDALLANLNENGQLDPGIITHAGILVNANTRAVALRQIGTPGYIRVAVLPSSATESEITELEELLSKVVDRRPEAAGVKRRPPAEPYHRAPSAEPARPA